MGKLIVLKWQAYNENILINQLKINGYDIVELPIKIKHHTRDFELAQKLINAINKEHAEAVITVNYLPIVSMVCDTCKIKYYAWVFNSPHLSMFAKPVTLDCNRIGTFDGVQAKILNDSGCNTVFHLPLAVDCDYYDKIIRNASKYDKGLKDKGYSDVEFIGSLYTDKKKLNQYDFLLKDVMDNNPSDEVKRTWNKVEKNISCQMFCYDRDYITNITEDEYTYLIECLRDRQLLLDEDYYQFDDEVLFNTIFAKKVTILEREKLLTKLADCCQGKYDFKLYTSSDVTDYPQLSKCNQGVADYETEMPIIFNRSKINVNITLRSIKSGIPLRVLDIMGCGGFVLTDPQPEILEYLEEDKEVVIYRSIEECLDKIDYYLKHEEDRRRIAIAGYEAVKKRFNYKDALGELLNR